MSKCKTNPQKNNTKRELKLGLLFNYFEALALTNTLQKTNSASVPPAVTTEVNKRHPCLHSSGAQTELVIELNISTTFTKKVKTVSYKMQVVAFALAPLTSLSESTIRQVTYLA